MKKSLFSLIAAAGLMAMGGLAQAQTYVVPSDATIVGHSVITTTAPGGGHTYWIDTPVLVGVAPSTTIDTTVLGAGPVMMPMESSVYVQPGWSGDYSQRHQAAATFNVPARAGEASTMTGGAPNMSTDNTRISNDIYVPVYSVPN